MTIMSLFHINDNAKVFRERQKPHFNCGRQSFRKQQIMAYIIAQPCIGVKDAACVTVCPVDCIHPTKSEAAFEAAELLYIDPGTCIDCGLCVDECPVKAIFPQEDLPLEWNDFIQRNADYFKAV